MLLCSSRQSRCRWRSQSPRHQLQSQHALRVHRRRSKAFSKPPRRRVRSLRPLRVTSQWGHGATRRPRARVRSVAESSRSSCRLRRPRSHGLANLHLHHPQIRKDHTLTSPRPPATSPLPPRSSLRPRAAAAGPRRTGQRRESRTRPSPDVSCCVTVARLMTKLWRHIRCQMTRLPATQGELNAIYLCIVFFFLNSASCFDRLVFNKFSF